MVVEGCVGCEHSGINGFLMCHCISIHELCKRVEVVSHIGGWGSSPNSLMEYHYGCLQECLLLYIVRAIWQEMYDIQSLTTL